MSDVSATFVGSYNSSRTFLHKLNVQIALNLVLNGSYVIFITQKANLLDFDFNWKEYAAHTIALERLNFRYLENLEQVKNWCQLIHRAHCKPRAIFVNAGEDIVGDNDFDISAMIAHLLDATHVCSRYLKKKTYLYVSVSTELCSPPPSFDQSYFLVRDLDKHFLHRLNELSCDRNVDAIEILNTHSGLFNAKVIESITSLIFPMLCI